MAKVLTSTMEAESKDDAVDKTSQIIKRAITWEISDSETDSESELCSSTAVVARPRSTAGQECAGKGKLDRCMRGDEASQVTFLAPLPQGAPSSPNLEKREKRSASVKARKLERELKKEERRRRKKQDELEKQKRKEAAAAMKSLRPNQCIKHMIVCVDPGLLEDPNSDTLLEALGSLESKYYIEPQTVPRCITWKRNLSNSVPGTDSLLDKAEEEREVLLLLEPWDFLKRLFSLMQSASPTSQQSRADLAHLLPFHSLEGHLAKACSLAVIGLEAYQWYNQHAGYQQEALNPGQEETRAPGPELSMTQHEIEEALVVLQLWGDTSVLLLETWQEFAQHVSAMTKAIAQRPYKKQRKTQPFSFCTDGRWASGVRVHKDGTGLREAWSRQIQQFNRVSPAVAAAIAQVYPSPSLLLQMYRDLSTDKDRQLLLSSIPVKREANETDRQVGPDVSRRIYLFMVSTNPELVLDLSA